MKNHEGRLIIATKNKADTTNIDRIKITWKQKREEKQFYVHSKRQTSEISHEKIWI